MVFMLFLETIGQRIGLSTIWYSHMDVKLLLVTRMIGSIAIGSARAFLAIFISHIGFSDPGTGLFMALTLVGDLLLDLLLACVGDRLGARVTIAFGCLLVSASGLIFTFCNNYRVLLLASITGVINPIASEVDPFKATEETAISRVSNRDDHPDIFRWWSLLGLVGPASGTLLAGFVVDNGQTLASFSKEQSFHIIFFGYSAIGISKLLCCLCISSDVEAKHFHSDGEESGKHTEESPGEQSPLLPHEACGKYEEFPGPEINKMASNRGFGFVPETTAFMWRFSLATFVDYVANGMALIPWMAYFFKRRYGISEGALGLVIFIASIFSAFVLPLSSPSASHIGRVPSMVLCHSLNSISLLMVTVPKCKAVALGLFMFRILTRELDNAPRLSLVAANVRDDEASSAMGIINAVKVIGCSVGLFLTGHFAAMDQFWIALTIAGCLKLVYNALITGFFWNQDYDF